MINFHKIIKENYKDASILEGCAVILAMDDNSIKINFLSQIPLTGHPIKQSDVDNVREAARKTVIEEAIKQVFIKEDVFP